MAKNDNENNILYGAASLLTPPTSVNIGQSGINITYNPNTPIWTNGVLNIFENLQDLTYVSVLFKDYNIFEQTNINDININTSIFKDVVDDKRVGEEQTLSVPIEMCTLYEIVDKVIPFSPYVLKNYSTIVDWYDMGIHNIRYPIYGILMTDDERTYCPTFSQINRSTELTVILYQDETFRNGRMFRFDGERTSLPQLTMKK